MAGRDLGTMPAPVSVCCHTYAQTDSGTRSHMADRLTKCQQNQRFDFACSAVFFRRRYVEPKSCKEGISEPLFVLDNYFKILNSKDSDWIKYRILYNLAGHLKLSNVCTCLVNTGFEHGFQSLWHATLHFKTIKTCPLWCRCHKFK